MLKVIDLFAGVGGLSLGAARAGFNIQAAVELDKFAIHSHRKNFPKSKHLQLDIATLSGRQLLDAADMQKGELSGLIGGPPCQGFSAIGHQKTDDARNDLFGHFFRLVRDTSPAFFVAENVPGILSAKYDSIRENALAQVRGKYVLLAPFKVKASEYGAPTIRTRVFFIGYDPKKISNPLDITDFKPPKEMNSVNVSKALSNLPFAIKSEWQLEESGWQRVSQKYANDYFYDRLTGCIPRGVGDLVSVERYKSQHEVSGCLGTLHSPEVCARYARLGIGEQDRISKSTRLNPNGFCPTLRAGTGSDKGSFQAVRPIHYSEARVITPREAARLQGFPDWFVFHATKWHSFRQIGNSVSPLVAEQILGAIYKKCAT